MRQLRVGNSLYMLPDDVWRQINDLLSKAETTRRLTQEMLKDEIPLDQTKESAGVLPDGTGSGPDSPKSLGEDLSDEEQP